MKEFIQLTKLVLLMLLLIVLSILLNSCRSTQETQLSSGVCFAEEHKERVSVGQGVLEMFDSLKANVGLTAECMEVEFFENENHYIHSDSLAATRPHREQAPVRLAARLKVNGICVNMQTSHTKVATSESLAMNADSVHRISHKEHNESIHKEKVVKPPHTLRYMSFLLGMAFICFIIWKVKK